MEGRRRNKVIAAYNVFEGAQTEIELAEIYLGIHNAMNSFSLTNIISSAVRKTSNIRLDNNILWIIIAAIHRDRFSIDCYHFESLYLILIWVAAWWKSCVDWKIGLFYQSVWLKEGLLLFTAPCLESRQEEYFVTMLILKYHCSWRVNIAPYGKRITCLCAQVCVPWWCGFILPSLTI